jgi:hypothetical protein
VGRAVRGLVTAGLVTAPLILAACGGRFAPPPATVSGSGTTQGAPRAAASGETTTSTSASAAASAAAPTAPRTPDPSVPPPAAAEAAPPGQAAGGADPTQKAIVGAYEAYLVDLSGLDDTLSRAYIGPLASVTTTRLAQASVRQAASILAAHEHGVGTLRDDHVSVVMTGPASAALADCQDEDHFTLVEDASGTPEPFVARGYFAGSAQMVLQGGHWLVDVFTTTHVACAF